MAVLSAFPGLGFCGATRRRCLPSTRFASVAFSDDSGGWLLWFEEGGTYKAPTKPRFLYSEILASRRVLIEVNQAGWRITA